MSDTNPTPSAIAQAIAMMWTQGREISPQRRETHRVAAEVRRLADLLVRTDADEALLAATADAIAEAVDRLAAGGVRNRHAAFAPTRSMLILDEVRRQTEAGGPDSGSQSSEARGSAETSGRAIDDGMHFAESSTAAATIAEALADPTRADELQSEHFHFDDSPVVGLANPLAPPVHLEIQGEMVVGWATFGEQYEGPPGYVHGGYVAAAFDDVLGMTQSLGGQPGMTGRLTIHYRRPHPLHLRIRYEGRLVRVDGRKTIVAGASYVDDTLLGEAEGLFISVDFTKMVEASIARTVAETAQQPK